MPTDLGITYTQSSTPLYDGENPISERVVEDWQLSEGYFVSAKKPMQQIFPRPDVDTSTEAFHRNAYVGMQYEIPIGVSFGAFPFYYTLRTAPTGATIGSIFSDSDYGVLKWTPTEIGTFQFKVRVQDQDLNLIDISWSVTVSNSWVIFVDSVSGSNTTGDGSISSPYETLEYAYTNASTKAICLLEGSYTCPTNGYSLNTSNTRSLFAYPGDSVNISGAGNTDDFGVFTWNTDDCWVSGIRLHSLQASSANPRWFYTSVSVDRLYQYNIHFDGGSIGTVGNDNNSCNFLSTASQRYYGMQSHCRFSNLPFTNNGFSAFDLYYTSYYLHQNNTYDGASSNARYGMWPKGNNVTDVCIRQNILETDWDNFFCNIYMSEGQEDIEVCYNLLRNSYAASPDKDHPMIEYAGQGTGGTIIRGPVWTYRNTIYGEPLIIDNYVSSAYPVELHFEKNIVVHNETFSGATHKIMMYNTNDASSVRRDPETRANSTITITDTECHGDTTDGIVDIDYLLDGVYRTTYLGKRGYEINTGT